MRRYPILILLLACIGVTNGQKPGRDSLTVLLKTTKEDTGRVLLLIDLVKANKNDNITQAYAYCDEALKLSARLGYNKGRLLAMRNKIFLLRIEDKDSIALEHCNEYLQVAGSLKDSGNVSIAYLYLGYIYNKLGNNEKGMENSLRGVSIAERLGNKEILQDAYLNMQRMYYSRSEFEKAIDYGRKAIAIGKERNDREDILKPMYNLAYTYNILKKFDSSAILSREVINLSRQLGEQRIESYALSNLCSVSLRTGNFKDALTYGTQCLELARKNSDKSIESTALSALGLAHLLLKQYKEAEQYGLQALALKNKLDDKTGRAEVEKFVADVYYALGDPVKAYDYEKRSEDYLDSANQFILSEQSSELEKKYETQKKEAQIQLQQAEIRRKSILNYVLLGGAAALLIIFILGYRNYKNRQNLQQARIDELEKEKQLTATEAVLKGEEQERTRLARDLHDGLGGMLSGIKHSLSNMKGNLIMTPDNVQAFERSIDMLDSSIKEMRRVAHNMMPEVLVKYGLDTALKEFCQEIDHSGVIHTSYHSIGMDKLTMEQTTAVTVYRIVQELVNNAIKHAAAEQVLVQAHMSEEEKLLTVTVEDDGKGFDTTTLKQASGIGWSNIQNRVEFLKGKIDIKSLPGKGTSVLIEINM